ncbi:MAG: phosphotransferase family protein [Gammaproteobacteria bacterium]
MPAPQERDLVKTATSLKEWFIHSQGLDPDIKIQIKGGPENTGFSNETLTFSIQFNNGKSDGYVIRFTPKGYKVFPEYDIKKQYQLMHFLEKHGVKVPHVIAFEDDTSILDSSFYLMRECSGQAPSDNPPFHQVGWVFDASPEVRLRMWKNWLDEMIKVHQINIENNCVDFLNRPNLANNHLDQELNFYFNFHDWAMDGESHPIAESAKEFLIKNKPKTDNLQSRIVWGDCRLANVMYSSNGELSAALDWEMAILGDPCLDLAWGIAIDDCNSLGLNIPKLPGFMSTEETISYWEKHSGFNATNYDYFYILALYKFTVIMTKVVKKLEYYEILPKGLGAHINNHASGMLAKHMESH